MFKAFANIARIPELRRKFLTTVGFLAICRLGVFIPIPGADLSRIRDLANTAGSGMGRLGVIADIFSGGAMQKAGLLALGIMP